MRGAADLVPTTKLLDDYRGMILCTFRKFRGRRRGWPRPLAATATRWRPRRAHRRRGQSLRLPRQPAAGERPGGRRAAQAVGRTSRGSYGLRHLVMDTGASIAPYNHIELGQPMFIDYVWGRQIGENTINP